MLPQGRGQLLSSKHTTGLIFSSVLKIFQLLALWILLLPNLFQLSFEYSNYIHISYRLLNYVFLYFLSFFSCFNLNIFSHLSSSSFVLFFDVSDLLFNLFNKFSNCVFHFQNFNLNLSLKTDSRPLVNYSVLSSIFLNTCYFEVISRNSDIINFGECFHCLLFYQFCSFGPISCNV